MYVVFLSVRYLISRVVSYLAMGAIGIGVMALIIVVSIMNGFLDETKSIVRGTSADIVIHPPSLPGQATFSREKLEDFVLSVPGVAGVTSRYVRAAVFKEHGASISGITFTSSSDARINQIIVLGVRAEDELGVTSFAEYLDTVETEALQVADATRPFYLDRNEISDRRMKNADLPRVLVGEELMEVLRLRKGDAVDIVTLPDSVSENEDVRFASTTFIVSGAFKTGHYDFDMSHVFVESHRFQKWTGTDSELSEMYVVVSDDDQLDAVRDDLRRSLKAQGVDASVNTWKDRNAVTLGAVENERNILFIVLSLFVLLTCTITFSMLAMMVQEKIRDIGILSALGAPSRGIGAVFALCGGMVATIGATIGLLTGTWAALNINVVREWIENLFGIEIFKKDVYAFHEIPTTVHHQLHITIAFVTVAFALIISMLPAWRAARMDPVEALRHD